MTKLHYKVNVLFYPRDKGRLFLLHVYLKGVEKIDQVLLKRKAIVFIPTKAGI